MTIPLMPKATAKWLINNSSLTFKQIADFCGFHELEVKSIADGEGARGIAESDPITSGQLSKEEIRLCEANPTKALRMLKEMENSIISEHKQKSKYVPIARRQDKPNAVLWLLKNCPEMQTHNIVRLIGTTKATVSAIRERTHWNMDNIIPKDPVLLGLCTQTELNAEYEKAKKKMADAAKATSIITTKAEAIMSAHNSANNNADSNMQNKNEHEHLNLNSVLGKQI